MNFAVGDEEVRAGRDRNEEQAMKFSELIHGSLSCLFLFLRKSLFFSSLWPFILWWPTWPLFVFTFWYFSSSLDYRWIMCEEYIGGKSKAVRMFISQTQRHPSCSCRIIVVVNVQRGRSAGRSARPDGAGRVLERAEPADGAEGAARERLGCRTSRRRAGRLTEPTWNDLWNRRQTRWARRLAHCCLSVWLTDCLPYCLSFTRTRFSIRPSSILFDSLFVYCLKLFLQSHCITGI